MVPAVRQAHWSPCSWYPFQHKPSSRGEQGPAAALSLHRCAWSCYRHRGPLHWRRRRAACLGALSLSLPLPGPLPPPHSARLHPPSSALLGRLPKLWFTEWFDADGRVGPSPSPFPPRLSPSASFSDGDSSLGNPGRSPWTVPEMKEGGGSLQSVSSSDTLSR